MLLSTADPTTPTLLHLPSLTLRHQLARPPLKAHSTGQCAHPSERVAERTHIFLYYRSSSSSRPRYVPAAPLPTYRSPSPTPAGRRGSFNSPLPPLLGRGGPSWGDEKLEVYGDSYVGVFTLLPRACRVTKYKGASAKSVCIVFAGQGWFSDASPRRAEVSTIQTVFSESDTRSLSRSRPAKPETSSCSSVMSTSPSITSGASSLGVDFSTPLMIPRCLRCTDALSVLPQATQGSRSRRAQAERVGSHCHSRVLGVHLYKALADVEGWKKDLRRWRHAACRGGSL